jgi:2,3-bisphosphoglycerate-dependent phosphoglycerate mutase
MKLLMARHGQSAWQVTREGDGVDPPLTELGEQQAHRLGEHLARTQTIRAIHASDLERARHTAEIVAAYLDLPVMPDPDLREYDAWEAGWAPNGTSQWDTRPSEPALAPAYAAFCTRVEQALRRIAGSNGSEGMTLIIAHGGTIGTIWRLLLGSHTPRLATWNTALHCVEWHHSAWGEHWVFHYSNVMEHLPPDMRTS